MIPALLSADPITFRDMSYGAAKALAKQEGKALFIDVYASWCAPCKMMENEVFSDSLVGQYMDEYFVSIRVDAEAGTPAVVRQYDVKAYPTLIILDSEGNLLSMQEGFMDKDTFLDLADDMLNRKEHQSAYNLSLIHI